MCCHHLQLEEEEDKDTFDVDVAVTNPEKVGQCLSSLYVLFLHFQQIF